MSIRVKSASVKAGSPWRGTFTIAGPARILPRMGIVGHGIDIVEIARIRELHASHGDRFLERCFTPGEQAYCAQNKKRYYEHLAGRFAAKEAILKVLGTGWRGGIMWTDIEILRESSGQPTVTLTGESASIAEKRGINRWHVSISHIETHATASAIGSAESVQDR